MTLYIYRDVITTDEDLMNEYLFDYLCTKCSDVRYAENHIDYEWDNVDQETVTEQEIQEYVDNGYTVITRGNIDELIYL